MKSTSLLLAAVCLTAQAADLAVTVTDAAGKPVADAVAWLVPPSGTSVPPPKAHAQIDQKSKQFAPVVSVIQTGTGVEFPNSDNIRHSVYSFSAPKPFTLKLYSGKPSNPVVFDKPGVVLLGCNIHDTMVAWVLVVDSPWFGRSSASGKLSMQGVPDGSYQLNVWHPGQAKPLPARNVTVGGTAAAVITLTLDAKPVESLIKATGGHAGHGDNT